MRKSRISRRRFLAPFLGCAMLFQLGPCTQTDVRQEFRNGFVTAVSGLLQIGVQAFADELFGVGN